MRYDRYRLPLGASSSHLLLMSVISFCKVCAQGFLYGALASPNWSANQLMRQHRLLTDAGRMQMGGLVSAITHRTVDRELRAPLSASRLSRTKLDLLKEQSGPLLSFSVDALRARSVWHEHRHCAIWLLAMLEHKL